MLSLSTAVYATDIITHPSNPQTMTKSLARAIFAGRMRTWPNGNPIRIVIMPEDKEVHEHFCRNILDVFPRQLRRSWDRGIYSGISEGPTIFDSEREILDFVSKNPGAIGYINSSIQPKEAVHVVTFE